MQIENVLMTLSVCVCVAFAGEGYIHIEHVTVIGAAWLTSVRRRLWRAYCVDAEICQRLSLRAIAGAQTVQYAQCGIQIPADHIWQCEFGHGRHQYAGIEGIIQGAAHLFGYAR